LQYIGEIGYKPPLRVEGLTKMKTGFQIAFFVLAVAVSGVQAAPELPDTMQEVLRIAHGISVVQPHLTDAEYVSYAMAIHRASRKYAVHPSVLISITQQESGFRANLPEGPAGEIGICQIIKSWLKNPNLVREFGTLTTEELSKPSTSFKVAAWILSELKDSALSGPLPFWSFYNSREFKNRFKYFQKVSKNLSALRKHAPTVYTDAVLVAASDQSQKAVEVTLDRKRTTREVSSERKVPDAVKAAKMLYPKRVSQRAESRFLQTASLN
jgi:hypothetical protein